MPQVIIGRNRMKEAVSEEPTAQECEDSDVVLANEWQSIDWRSVEEHVGRLQTKISKATVASDNRKAEKLSYLLTHSFDAKALAVRTVTTNKGRHTPGVDNVLWETDAQKMRAVKELDPNHYHALPLRRVLIPKSNGKMRPLGIPTMHDRAMQTLYQLALDPVFEAIADPNAYGFRKGRSRQDVCEQLFKLLSTDRSAGWILEGDIRGCFDHISHDWLLANVPMDKRVLKKFLDAGYVFEDQLYPTEEGTPQGGAISPLLANFALNGMEALIAVYFGKGSKVHVVKYADDFVVTAPTPEMAEEVRSLLVPFLAERGLELSDEKTKITSIDEGFDFVGYNFRKYDGKLIIKPSKKSFESVKDAIREIVLGRGKALSQDELIGRLNPVIIGWCGQYRTVCAKKTFAALHDYLYQLLRQWGHRRHSRKSYGYVYGRYWRKVGENNWVFATEDVALYSPKQMAIRRHIKVRMNANPYIDTAYFAERKKNGTDKIGRGKNGHRSSI